MRAKNELILFLVLLIVASTLFSAAASAATNPVTRLPANTGFAGQGQSKQGMQTGFPGQGQGTGIGSGAANVPGQTGIGQQHGSGITVGDQPGQTTRNPTGTVRGAAETVGGGAAGGGGPGTCACITAPCNCGETSGGTGVIPAAQQPQRVPPLQPSNLPLPTPSPLPRFLQNQQFQGQQFQTQPLTAPAGTSGNAGGFVQQRQF